MADPRVIVRDRCAHVRIEGGATKRVALDAGTVARIRSCQTHAITRPVNAPVNVARRDTVVHTGAGMGVQGPKGEPGETEGATFLAFAGATIHGHRAVRIAAGAVYPPNVLDPTHATAVIGIAMQSAAAGTLVLVRTGGISSEASWTWSPGAVWCGQDGVLTQAPSATGWILAVGRAVSATDIVVDIDTPFMR